MTAKQRVLTAIAHQESDRVPVNYSANAGIDGRLRRHFGGKDLLEALGVDFRHVGAPYNGPRLHAEEGDVKVDCWGIHRRWVEHSSGGYWDYCHWPLATAGLDEVEAWPMPAPDGFDYSGIAAACDRMRDYCITCGGAGYPDIINGCGMLRTMAQALVDLVTDDPAGLRLVDRRVEIQLEILRRTLEAGRGGIDLLCLGEDLGTQRGPTISPALFRRHIRPRIQRFVDLAGSFGIPAMIHSCGSSSWAFDDFIEMGISVVETLQPEAADMDPAYLKGRYGDRLAFHGCISTAGPLAYGTAEDVERTVRRTLEAMMPGGGYILAPTHQIQDNSPTENVLAMYAAARKWGTYRQA
jgi:uroporphyrinogen decarboxylase